jgi:hypothetical protein
MSTTKLIHATARSVRAPVITSWPPTPRMERERGATVPPENSSFVSLRRDTPGGTAAFPAMTR